MKKEVVVAAALTLSAILAGCGSGDSQSSTAVSNEDAYEGTQSETSETAAEEASKNSEAAKTEDAESQPEDDDADSAAETEGSSEDDALAALKENLTAEVGEVVLDDDVLKITVNGTSVAGPDDEFYIWDLTVQNKTSDDIDNPDFENIAFNGIYFHSEDSGVYTTFTDSETDFEMMLGDGIPAGQVTSMYVVFSVDDMNLCRFTDVTKAEATVHVSGEYLDQPLEESTIAFYPHGETAASDAVFTPLSSDVLLFENDTMTTYLTYAGCEESRLTLVTYVENAEPDGDGNFPWIEASEVSADGTGFEKDSYKIVRNDENSNGFTVSSLWAEDDADISNTEQIQMNVTEYGSEYKQIDQTGVIYTISEEGGIGTKSESVERQYSYDSDTDLSSYLGMTEEEVSSQASGTIDDGLYCISSDYEVDHNGADMPRVIAKTENGVCTAVHESKPNYIDPESITGYDDAVSGRQVSTVKAFNAHDIRIGMNLEEAEEASGLTLEEDPDSNASTNSGDTVPAYSVDVTDTDQPYKIICWCQGENNIIVMIEVDIQ